MEKGYSGHTLPQDHYEFESFLQLLNQHECESYLEIGARFGDSFYAACSRLPVGSTCVAVDLPNASWGVDHSHQSLNRAVNALQADGYDARLILGDSRHEHIINAASMFGPFDAVFIDGDHTYKGCKADYDNYSPLASKLVAFHDIAPVSPHELTTERRRIGVPQLWNELKASNETIEYVCSVHCSIGMGIGVIIK